METEYLEQTHTEIRRQWPARPPRAVAAAGSLIVLLGLWAFFAPLVGPYFDFGFVTEDSWSFSEEHWVLSLAPGLAAVAAGLAIVMAPTRRFASLFAILAAVAGGWLLVGPSLYPLWSSGEIEPIAGSETTSALLWVGYFYGTGALIVFLAGLVEGLLVRSPRRAPDAVEQPLDEEEHVVERPVVVG